MIDIIIAAFLGLGVVICCAFMAVIQVYLNGYERHHTPPPVYKSSLEQIMEDIDKGVLHV